MGEEARTAASTATNPHANERVVLVTSLDGIAKPNAIKDGVFVVSVDYVLNGSRFSFRIGLCPELKCLKSAKANCPSAHQHPSVIDHDLPKEVMLGRVFGPVAHMPLPNLQMSRSLIGKVDIKSAYLIVPVHPSDRHLLGMFWHG